MDPFHYQLARVGLLAAARYGFALAGGYAVQAHEFLTRRSEDVDLFTTAASEQEFPAAVASVVQAYRDAGLTVDVTMQNDAFVRLKVSDGEGRSSKVELGVDWRAHPPVRMEIGPVLHIDDAVANKVATLFGRAEPRDYVDVDAVLRSGRYSRSELLRLGAESDPGFDPTIFATALLAIERLPDRALAVYGLSHTDIAGLRERCRQWADELLQSQNTPPQQ